MVRPLRTLGGLALLGLFVGLAPLARSDGPKRDKPFEAKPLTELGTAKYKQKEGGLYPGGKNERPAAHEAAGLALAKTVRCLDADGKPSENGCIVLLSVGMSNATQEFSAFQQMAERDQRKNPLLTIVDGAQGGMTALRIQDPDDHGSGTRYWDEVDRRLKAAGVTRAQVEVAWVKEADAQPTQAFPKHAEMLTDELVKIARVLHDRFSNMKLAYVSSRTYGGYAKTNLNPEPFAYETGFAVKWLVERQIQGKDDLNSDAAKGKVRSPWLSWGPYLWGSGPTARSDGLVWEPSDFTTQDGTHPTDSGRRKVADILLKFFTTDPTASPWFLAP